MTGIAAQMMLTKSPALLTYIGNNSASPAATTTTFTAQGIGTASADRVVVVAIAVRIIGTTPGTLSVTIGGTTATQLAFITDVVASSTLLGLYALPVAAGTTANIVLNTTQSMNRCMMAVWALTGNLGVSTPIATATNNVNANPITAAITPKGGGTLLAVAVDGSGNSTTYTWGGVTLDTQFVLGTNSFSAAHTNAVVGPSVTASATFSAAPTEAALIAAAW